MTKKKTIKKIKSATKNMAKKTSEIASTLKKQWKKEQPQREKLKKAANKAFKDGVKISGDVFETIRKDLNEIKRQG